MASKSIGKRTFYKKYMERSQSCLRACQLQLVLHASLGCLSVLMVCLQPIQRTS